MVKFLVVSEYIRQLLSDLKFQLQKEPSLIKLNSRKVLVVGDTHGAIDITSYAFYYLQQGYEVIMLGDLVDGGKYSLRNLLFSLEEKLLSKRVIIIRGNHESSTTASYYGFLDELREVGLDSIYDDFLDLFSSLPYAVLLNSNILLIHGGIPREGITLSELEKLRKGDRAPYDPIAFQILWNDPMENVEGFQKSERGPGIFYFGEDSFNEFMERNKLKYLIRGHEVEMNGIGTKFHGKLITVFSSDYHGGKKGLLMIHGNRIKRILINHGK